MTAPANTDRTLEGRLRALHETQCCDHPQCLVLRDLRAAAAIGAELAYEEAARVAEHQSNELADSIRAIVDNIEPAPPALVRSVLELRRYCDAIRALAPGVVQLPDRMYTPDGQPIDAGDELRVTLDGRANVKRHAPGCPAGFRHDPGPGPCTCGLGR